MTNADKFKGIFGLYATEIWAKPEKEFLEWLNEDVPETNVGDMISRQSAIELLNRWSDGYKYIEIPTKDAFEAFMRLPSAQSDIKAAYEQGRIMGRVEMRTELLTQLKEIVGGEVWANI